MKKYIFLGLLIIIVGAAAYLMLNLESIVKKVVHKYGSEVTATSVDLNGFSLSLTDGVGKIKRITVANPKGYNSPYIFELDEIVIKVDVKSVTSDTIIIDKVEVNKPKITYEMLSLTQNNIMQIQKNVANYSKKSASQTPAQKKEATKEGPGKTVIIKSLTINSGELQAMASIPGVKSQNVSVKLPPIKMTNIGGKQKPVADVIQEIITQILSTASQTVVNSNLTDLTNLATDQINMAKDTVNQAKDSVDQTTGALKDTAKSIGGIFGK